MDIRKSAYKQVLDFEKAISFFNDVHLYFGEEPVNVQAEITCIKRRLSESLAKDGVNIRGLFDDDREGTPIAPLTGTPTDDEREAAITFIKRAVDIFTIITAMEGIVSFACLVDSHLDSKCEFNGIRDKFGAALLSSSLLPAEDKKRVRALIDAYACDDEQMSCDSGEIWND